MPQHQRRGLNEGNLAVGDYPYGLTSAVIAAAASDLDLCIEDFEPLIP